MVFFLRVMVVLAVLLESGALVAQEIVWRDEFNGENLDRETWTHDVGGHGFGNGQLEFNTARRENSYVKDGSLVIEARREKYLGREFTSARLNTQGRFAYQYGTLEARIQVPDTADGIWPAFWLLGNNFPAVQWPKCGEIDILEIGGKEGIAKGEQHRSINCALHFADQTQK
ncbi:MAG: glycoside hydrolase family 16 protein, partial [Planctomycetota bacterium]|nr:glycoside hydrolase family 16 protein [Planctomycetota bacterium]